MTTVRSALTFDNSLPVPLGWNPMESAVTSFGSLRLNDRVRVRQFGPPTTALPAPVTNIGSVETNIGVDAVVGTVLSRAPVTLRDRAFVNGSLYTSVPSVRQAGASVALFSQEDVGLVLDGTWRRQITWPTNVQPGQMLEPGQSPTFVNLAPGAYQFAVAKSGRGFNLRTGVYYFDYMTIEPQGHLAIDALNGPVTVYVKEVFTLRENMGGPGTIPSPGIPIPSFMVIAEGSGSSLIEKNFQGVMFANGIIVSAGVTVRGALIGGTVTVHQNAVVEHVRDSYAFQRFETVEGVGRTQVSGASIRRGTEVMDEYLQSETVTAITVNPPNSTAAVMVGYIDKTEPTVAPKVTYPAGRNGSERLVQKGASLMGWSFSTDGGRSFTYGGRVVPPTGWSALWGDPSIAKVSIADQNVYFGNLGGTTAAFDLAAANDGDGDNQTLHNSTPPIDGFCVARSTDRGIHFSDPACVQTASADGGTMAAVLNNGRREVYLTGNIAPVRVWRVDGDATPMTFTELPPVPLPAGTTSCSSHPRMRARGGLVYVLCRNINGQIVGNTLNIATATWQTPRVIASGATAGGGQSIRLVPAVSFDVGTNLDDEPKVRVMFMVDEGGTAGQSIVTYECQPDLSQCGEVVGWSTRGMAGSEEAPSLRFMGFGKWAAAFLSEVNTTGIGVRVGFLDTETHTSGGLPVFRQKIVGPSQFPCRQGSNYWGDYNEIDTYGESGVFVPYTVNGPGSASATPNCRYRGNVLADQHVAGAAVGP